MSRFQNILQSYSHQNSMALAFKKDTEVNGTKSKAQKKSSQI